MGLLMCVFLGSIWLTKQNSSHELSQFKPKLSQEIDFFSKGYTQIQMTEKGGLKQRLDALSVEHDAQLDVLLFSKPIVTVYKNITAPWIMRSDQGRASKGGKDIFLEGNVYIDRAKSEHKRAVSIVTRNLSIKTDIYYAETNEWAELVTKLDTMSGVGLRLFYQDPLYIELLTKVRGRREFN